MLSGYKHNFKIQRNIFSSIHASCVILSYLLGLPGYILYYISMAYYGIDTCLELLTMHSIYNIGMTFHHIVSLMALGYLHNPSTYHHIYFPYFITELSNLPLYVVYHLKAVKYNNKYMMNLLLIIEATIYIGLRLVYGLKMGYVMLFINYTPWPLLIAFVLIYLMSMMWAKGLCRQIQKAF